MARRQSYLRNRSVVEIMVITFTFLIVLTIVSVTLVIAIIEITSPTTDTSSGVDFLTRIVTSLLAGLFGLLAGQNSQLDKRPDGTQDDISRPGEVPPP